MNTDAAYQRANAHEPLIMPFQEQPFNGDKYIQKEFLKLKKKYNITTAIETGSALGYTTKWLAENFDKVKAIEVNATYFALAASRLTDYENAQVLLGDTVATLQSILSDVKDDTIFFLDAHWGLACPLESELQQIATVGIKPVITIHDFQVPDHPELGYDEYDGHPFSFEWLKPRFDAIYGENGYEGYYNEKAEGAMRGIIYICPK